MKRREDLRCRYTKLFRHISLLKARKDDSATLTDTYQDTPLITK